MRPLKNAPVAALGPVVPRSGNIIRGPRPDLNRETSNRELHLAEPRISTLENAIFPILVLRPQRSALSTRLLTLLAESLARAIMTGWKHTRNASVLYVHTVYDVQSLYVVT